MKSIAESAVMNILWVMHCPKGQEDSYILSWRVMHDEDHSRNQREDKRR